MYYSTPTWANHIAICKGTGLEIGQYRYYAPKTKDVDFEGMCEDSKNWKNTPWFYSMHVNIIQQV